jgi:hypothetical protein
MEFVQGHYSFPDKAAQSGQWNADDDPPAELMEIFGPFLKSLLEKGTRTHEFFDKDGGSCYIFRRDRSTLCIHTY